MAAPRTRFVDPAAPVPLRWSVESSASPRVGDADPDLQVWSAVAEDEHGELLMAVSLSDRSWLDAYARRRGARLEPATRRSHAAEQLTAYLAGQLREFDLRVLALGSEFERQAWQALTQIPHGETRSYAEQARMLASPKPGAARAVGRANARNPVPIVVPCHRVIGSDGSLTGFAGGLALKRWLLAHEGVRLPSEAGPRLTPSNQLALF